MPDDIEPMRYGADFHGDIRDGHFPMPVPARRSNLVRDDSVSGMVVAIQAGKQYPGDYVPPWISRRAERRQARVIKVIEQAVNLGESLDRPPAEREGPIHQGAEKAIHLLAVVIALGLTAVGKARHLLP